MENLAISALGMAPDRPFWLRFDLRTADPKDLSRVWSDSGISVSGLIEIFSRTAGPERAALDDGEAAAADRSAPHAWPGNPKRVNRLRNRLILIFVAATLAPLLATVWITSAPARSISSTFPPPASWSRFQIARADRAGILSACLRRS